MGEVVNLFGEAVKRKPGRHPWKISRDGVLTDRETGEEIGTVVRRQRIRFAALRPGFDMWQAESEAGEFVCRLRDDAAECAWIVWSKDRPAAQGHLVRHLISDELADWVASLEQQEGTS